MTQTERQLNERVELAAAMIVDAIMTGVHVDDVKRMTRDVFHKAAALRRAEIARRKRNRAARERNDVMRSLGLRRTSCGWE